MKLVAGCVVALAACVVPAASASAHPLGNFTVNTYSGLRVEPDQVLLDLVVDMAEIPTFQVRRSLDADGDGAVSAAEAKTYTDGACATAARQVHLSVGGRSLRFGVHSADVSFPPGAADLPTLRLTCGLAVGVELHGEEAIVFRNDNDLDRVGWREVTALGDGVTLTASDVPATSRSDRLRSYPADLLSSPLDQRTAALRARRGGPAAPQGEGISPASAQRPATSRGVDAATRAFTALVARQRLNLLFGALALVLAVVLGGVHALAPGHGKTIMAAYLVGQRGSLRHAALIALTVTITHTAGVLALGAVLSASSSLAPESIYPWLGVATGVLLVAIGGTLVWRAIKGRPLLVPAIGRSAPTEHGHHHAGHHHVDGRHDHSPRPTVNWRTLVPMGLAGGMTPSPSALVVLLGAIALGRAWFGVALVVAYGFGMAAVLTVAGLVLVRTRGAVERRLQARSRSPLTRLAPYLPVASSLAIVVGGLYLAGRGLLQL